LKPRLTLSVPLLLLSAAATAAPIGSRNALVVPADSIRYSVRVTNNNLCGLTVTNWGFLGNNFALRTPSFEYPLGSGFDHMPRAGLWIGAHATDAEGSFIGVTTAAQDGIAGSSPQASTEFTPACLDIRKRSTLVTSPAYDPEAVSEEDLIGFYSDEPARTFSPEDQHRPLNVLVRQECYDWSVLDAAHFIILRYVITNLGAWPLEGVHVGLYTEFASGNKNLCSMWPPSAAFCTDGSWYRKKWVQYDDSLRLFREHYCRMLPVPSACNLSAVPAWVGLKLLGTRDATPADTGQHVTMGAWLYSPGDTTRNEDSERYAIMSSGHIQDLSGPDFQPYTGDPCELLAVGPFATMGTGDSIAVTFALVGGTEVADIQQHARAAQRLYDAGFDMTVPVEVSLVFVEAEPGLARIRWLTSAGTRWNVARSESGAPWTPMGGIEADGGGHAIFEDRTVIAGVRYGYRLESQRGEAFGEAWVDVPRAFAFALLGAVPNPARDGLRISFTLAEAGAVRIELLDISGRRVRARDLGNLGAGSHVERLERGGLAPGTYFVRLRQSGRIAARPIVLIE